MDGISYDLLLVHDDSDLGGQPGAWIWSGWPDLFLKLMYVRDFKIPLENKVKGTKPYIQISFQWNYETLVTLSLIRARSWDQFFCRVVIKN